MNAWQVLAEVGCLLGNTAFGGGLLTFFLLFRWADRRNGLAPAHLIDEAFRSVSLAMSLGLTLLILSNIVRYALRFDGFHLPVGTPWEYARISLFVLMWLSWGWLEVVILHRFRLEVPSGEEARTPAYARAREQVKQFTIVIISLFIGSLLLDVLSTQ